MTLDTARVTNDMLVPLVVEEVNRLRIHERLHKTVDSKQKWDGKIDASNFIHKTSNGHIAFGAHNTFTCFIPLTYGALKIIVAYYSGRTDLHYISFSYHLPSPAQRWQLLYRDRLEREVYDKKIQETVRKFKKCMVTKVNGLLDGIEDWYKSAGINPQKFTFNPGYGASKYSANFEYLVGAVGRVRLLSQLHADKTAAMGVPSHGERINELANEMLRLLIEQQSMGSNFEDAHFSESY